MFSLVKIIGSFIYSCRFDPESEGFVSTEELQFVLANLPVKIPKPELEEMIAAADSDGDGKISFLEFRRLVGM